jgi:carboxylesterase type B
MITYSFSCSAWADDPIVAGFAADSGTAGLLGAPPTTTNFTYVAQQVGCAQTDKDDQFACMQSADATAIISVLNTYNSSFNGGKSLSFTPAADDETSFGNYTDLAVRGKFARRPMIVGNNDNEGASLLPYRPDNINQTAFAAFTNASMDCPAARTADTRASWNVPVWRYRYLGTWPNMNPLPWLGAYHSSELAMIFDTADYRGPNAELEEETIKYMQGAWVAFAKDPVNGLSNYGWPVYNPEGDTLVQLGYQGNAGAVIAASDKYDETCS